MWARRVLSESKWRMRSYWVWLKVRSFVRLEDQVVWLFSEKEN